MLFKNDAYSIQVHWFSNGLCGHAHVNHIRTNIHVLYFLLQLKAQKVSVGSVGVLLTMPIVNHQWRQSPLAMSPRAIYVLLALGCPVLMFLSINFLLWSSGRLSCCLRVAFIHCYTSDSSWNQLKCLRQRIHAADFVCQNTGEAFSARVGGSMVSCRFAHIL